MLLAVVLLMLAGFAGMGVAVWRCSRPWPENDLSPLFETSLLLAVVGLVLTLAVAVIEAVQQLLAVLLFLVSGFPLP